MKAGYKLIMSFGNNKIKIEMIKSDHNFIVITKKCFLGFVYSKKDQVYNTFDEAEDRFSELKNEIKFMTLIK